jgi:eukaryotic-like serine/threonine-protein kinase
MTVPDLTNHTIDRYKLVQRLRQRPLTSLYLGQDTQIVRPVFVQVLNTSVADDEELAGRFQRRLEIVRQLEHPHIAPIIQAGRTTLPVENGKKGAQPQQYVYAIIRYVPGPTLAEQIEKWQQDGRKPDALESLSLVHSLASALAVAHPLGIFHHDLRPSNLIMGENGRLTFIDLGTPIAPQPPIPPLDPQNPPRMLDYASPEQLEGKPLSGGSNLYSLGVLLYELLAGHRPLLPISNWDIFERRELPREIPLPEVRADLTKATYNVVKNCMWRQEWNRYQSADHLVKALEAAYSAEAKNRKPPAIPIPTLSRPVWRYAGLGVLLLLLLVGGIWLLL